MHKSKSCEDLRINIRYSSDATDVNSNVIVTNLMKTGPSRKVYEQDQPDAYDLANAEKRKGIDDCKMMKCYDPSPRASACRVRKCLSQEEMEKLINIEDQLKLLAYQTICSRVPLKSRTPLRITAKQLTETDMRTMPGRLKRSELTKKVMANATENINKNKKQKKNGGLTNSSSQSTQSISSHTFETFKRSFQQQTRQQKAMKAEKVSHFQKIKQKKSYQQIYNTERRKQAWNAYLQAERNKVIMSRPGQHNTYITFINMATNKIKKNNKNGKKVQERDDDDKYIQTLKAFKSFNKNFETFSANYKIKLR